jgi:Fur family transcriptional regulator, ferric uptake regulator
MDRTLLFQRFLQRRRLKNTAERRAILREITALRRHHFSAEDLSARFRARGAEVSRATVYRTLEHLVRGGLLHRLSLGRRHFLFESVSGRGLHEHLTCLGCGEVTEFTSLRLDRILREVCRRNGFTARLHAIQITGICRKCSTREHRRLAPEGSRGPGSDKEVGEGKGRPRRRGSSPRRESGR